MNEVEIMKLLAGLGGPGIVAAVMWFIARRFIEAHATQVQTTQAEMSKRIDATEKRNDECEEDRKRLHNQLIEVMRDPKHK